MLLLPIALLTIRQDGNPSSDVAKGISAFSKKLFGTLPAKPGSNLIASPYSVSSCLGLLLPGVGKNDSQRIAKALDGPSSVADACAGYRALNSGMTGASGGLVVANSVWTAPAYQLTSTYIAKAKKDFDAQVQTLTATGSTGVKEVNDWIGQKTKGRITNLLQQLSADTSLVLVNAVSFDGAWSHRFNATQTTNKPFHLQGHDLDVPMMAQTETTRYGEGKGYRAVELDYQAGGFSMIVLLPDSGVDPARLLKTIDLGNLPPMSLSRVDLEFPKFKFSSRFDLMHSLNALGLGFMTHHLDAEPMLGTSQNMALSQLLHGAEIEVDEKGTRAAAATAGVVTRAAIILPPLKTVFHVDHPFAFIIRHEPTQTPLFMGVVYEPSRH